MKRGFFLLLAVSLAVAALSTRPTAAASCCTAQDVQACRRACQQVDPGCIGGAGCFAGSCNCSCQCP